MDIFLFLNSNVVKSHTESNRDKQSLNLLFNFIFLFLPPTLYKLDFHIVALIVSLCWFNLSYLSMFVLIILKKLRQRNCRLETLFSG